MNQRTPTDHELEELAFAMVEEGAASKQLVQALEQLIADRTNGEPLDDAYRGLRDALGAD